LRILRPDPAFTADFVILLDGRAEVTRAEAVQLDAG
jgi:hypothetical protein